MSKLAVDRNSKGIQVLKPSCTPILPPLFYRA